MNNTRVMVLSDELRAKLARELGEDAFPPSSRVALVSVPGDEAQRRAHVHSLGNALARVRGILTVIESNMPLSDEQREKFTAMLRDAHEQLSLEHATWEMLYLG